MNAYGCWWGCSPGMSRGYCKWSCSHLPVSRADGLYRFWNLFQRCWFHDTALTEVSLKVQDLCSLLPSWFKLPSPLSLLLFRWAGNKALTAHLSPMWAMWTSKWKQVSRWKIGALATLLDVLLTFDRTVDLQCEVFNGCHIAFEQQKTFNCKSSWTVRRGVLELPVLPRFCYWALPYGRASWVASSVVQSSIVFRLVVPNKTSQNIQNGIDKPYSRLSSCILLCH